jgi:hypothetical protein
MLITYNPKFEDRGIADTPNLLARRVDRPLLKSYLVTASPIVCMMFTEDPLTKKKLKEFQGDALAMRMQFFSPKGFLASKGVGPGGITAELDNGRNLRIAPGDECGGHWRREANARARHRRPRLSNGERRDAIFWRGGVPKKRNAAGTRWKPVGRTNRVDSYRAIGPAARKAV